MSLDVLLREVDEKVKEVFLTKGKSRGVYDGEVQNNVSFYYVSEYIKKTTITPGVVVWDDQ